VGRDGPDGLRSRFDEPGGAFGHIEVVDDHTCGALETRKATAPPATSATARDGWREAHVWFAGSSALRRRLEIRP